jgi:hypothetical protein
MVVEVFVAPWTVDLGTVIVFSAHSTLLHAAPRRNTASSIV